MIELGWIIYFIGVVIAFVILLSLIVKINSTITLTDIILATIFSVVSYVVLLVCIIDWIFRYLSKIVIYKKKEE